MHLKTIYVSVTFYVTIVDACQKELSSKCVPKAEIQPCTCESSPEGLQITCDKITENSLNGIGGSLIGRNIQSFKIVNSTFTEILGETFQNITPHTLHISKSKVDKFNLFSELDYMSDTLTALIIRRVFVDCWIISPGDNLTNLETFEITDCPKKEYNFYIILYLPEGLKRIIFQNCGLNSSNTFSFERFKNIESLKLGGNRLTSVNRSHLPQPASKLYHYDLSNNPIADLPKDMFEEMPSLGEVLLHGTSLTRLDYYTFKPVLNYLKQLTLYNIPLICDCSVSWLLMKRTPWRESDVLCQNPNSLKNRNLDSLMPKDMCINCQEILPVSTTTSDYTTASEREHTDDESQTDENVTMSPAKVEEDADVNYWDYAIYNPVDVDDGHCERCLCLE